MRSVNYLSKIRISALNDDEFPFTLPLFRNGFEMELNMPITFLVGDNGTGKSTFLENLARAIGFNTLGGNKNHLYSSEYRQDGLKLSEAMSLSWKRKTGKGFFFRAETFFSFADYLEEMAEETGALAYHGYGGKSFNRQSHGESFLSLFQNKFKEGIFLLDEPESALSVERQFALLRIFNRLAKSGKSQFVIVTHSPVLIAIPDAAIYEVDGDGKLRQRRYAETKQFTAYRSFLNDTDRFVNYLCAEEE